MKQPSKKKLALTTQTVRALRADQLDAAGANWPSFACPTRLCNTQYIGCTSVICP